MQISQSGRDCRSRRDRDWDRFIAPTYKHLRLFGNLVDQLVQRFGRLAAVAAHIGSGGMFAVALGLLVKRVVPAAAFGVGKTAIIGVEASGAGNRDEQDDNDPYDHSGHLCCPSGSAIMLARSRLARNGRDYHRRRTPPPWR